MSKISSKAKRYYNKLIGIMHNPVMQILPGQIAFFFLLASIPIILILGILAPIFSFSMENIANFIKFSLPASTSKLILPLVRGKGFDINVVILVVSALYLASRGTKSIIIASSTIYEVEKDNQIKNIIKSFVITTLLILVFLFLSVISVFGGRILNILSFNNDIVNIINEFTKYYYILRWPISFFVIFFVVKLVYTISPNKKIKSKSVNNGALFTTLFWILSTAIYSYYITHFSSYNIFYGSAANVIILLLWIYIISYIFVFGMVINATTDRINSEDSVN